MRNPPAYRDYTSRPRIRPVYICYYFFSPHSYPRRWPGTRNFPGTMPMTFFTAPLVVFHRVPVEGETILNGRLHAYISLSGPSNSSHPVARENISSAGPNRYPVPSLSTTDSDGCRHSLAFNRNWKTAKAKQNRLSTFALLPFSSGQTEKINTESY